MPLRWMCRHHCGYHRCSMLLNLPSIVTRVLRITIIVTSFVCYACSITTSSSIVAELRSEIAALKAKVSQLRSALSSANEKLEKELAESRAASQNAISNTISGRTARPEAQQHHSNGRRDQVSGRPCHGTRPARTHQAASGSTRTRPCTLVEGKIKIRGTWRTTAVNDITRTIHSLTSIKTDLIIKHKYKTRRSYTHTVSRWWFVISGKENLLHQLQDEWPTVTDSNQRANGPYSHSCAMIHRRQNPPFQFAILQPDQFIIASYRIFLVP